jgi:hypothetical protein
MSVAVLRRLALFVLLPLLAVGCEEVKSANPLSPLVAGPMAGISIDAPQLLSPASAVSIDDDAQPITLVVANPGTNTPRTVSLDFQVAADAGFTNLVFSKNGVPEADGQTKIQVDRLPYGHTYYWRVRGGDGANGSDWSAPSYFVVQAPVVLGVPTPKSPISGARISTLAPDLIVTNGASTGPHGPLQYHFQVSENQAFSSVVVSATSAENASGQTHLQSPTLAMTDHLYYWRVRILDGARVGAWSRVETFQTPSAGSAAPPSGGGDGGVDTTNCEAYVSDKDRLVECIHDEVRPGPTVEDAFEVTKRVAWALRGEKAGLLIKNGGENIISWHGMSFSAGRICYPDGHIYKVLTDIPATNGPSWQDDGFVDPSLYVPAIDPN